MMHLLHRTIPFITVAALVTVAPAGAQERDDSTSTAGAVVSLLGLGGNFVGFGSSSEDASRVNAWNCAGGCASFGARRSDIARLGRSASALRPSTSAVMGHARSEHMPNEHADLTDYGWSRRVGTDGVPLAPLKARRVSSSDQDDAAPAADIADVVPLLPPAPDGAGQAPPWVAPGSSSGAAALAAAWSDESAEPAGGPTAAAEASRSTPPGQMIASDQAISARAASFDISAPLVTTVPEPSTVVLLAVGMSSLLLLRRRSTRRR